MLEEQNSEDMDELLLEVHATDNSEHDLLDLLLWDSKERYELLEDDEKLDLVLQDFI